MAEVVAGAVIAEQVISTTIQGGGIAYAIAKPTHPLKASLAQVQRASNEQDECVSSQTLLFSLELTAPQESPGSLTSQLDYHRRSCLHLRWPES